MKVVWSEEAAAGLRERYGAEIADFRLVYDNEGCGCAVNGVPALWAVDGPGEGDIAAESGPFRLWHDPRHTLYFDETLHIGYLPDLRSFRLSSDSQIYTTRMLLADQRVQKAAIGHRP